MKRFFFFLLLLSSFSFKVFAGNSLFHVVGCIDCTDPDFFIGIKNKSASTLELLKQDIIDMGCFASKHSSGDVRATRFTGDTMFYTYCSDHSTSDKRIQFSTFTCPDGEEWNSELGKCIPEQTRCKTLAETDPKVEVWWVEEAFGSNMTGEYWCASGSKCVSQLRDHVGCDPDSGRCFADAYLTGDECSHGILSGFCTSSTCSDPLQPKPPVTDPDPDPDPDPDDPTHKPDDPTGGDIEDPSVLPDSDSDVVVPDKPDGKPDVEDPDIKPETDKAVVDAVVGMNRDVNKALNDLHIDINKNKADIQNEIRFLNASVVTNTQAVQKQQINDNEIYRKTKALIQQANADITTAVNRNTGAINSVGEDVGKIAGSMEGIAEDVAGISETLDGIANTDTSGAGIGGTCIQAGNCKGFYNSGYPQGLNGLVSGQLENLKNNTIDKFVNSFGKMDLSNAKRPSFVLPVPFFGDFSFEAYINFDWIFGFVRACLIMTSIFAARRIIFGG